MCGFQGTRKIEKKRRLCGESPRRKQRLKMDAAETKKTKDCTKPFIGIPVTMAKGSHLFPYRTQKLSLSAPMVLGWRRPGRVGRCRIPNGKDSTVVGSFLFAFLEERRRTREKKKAIEEKKAKRRFDKSYSPAVHYRSIFPRRRNKTPPDPVRRNSRYCREEADAF